MSTTTRKELPGQTFTALELVVVILIVGVAFVAPITAITTYADTAWMQSLASVLVSPLPIAFCVVAFVAGVVGYFMAMKSDKTSYKILALGTYLGLWLFMVIGLMSAFV